MIHTYLDSSTFRYLKNSQEDHAKEIISALIASKSNLLTLYSHAHIVDLKKDKTNKKYEDLQFMEGIVKNHYLCHYWNQKDPIYYTFTPSEAFEENLDHNPFDFNILNNLESIFENKAVKDLMTPFMELLDMKVPFLNSLLWTSLPEESQEAFSEIFSKKENQSLREIIEQMTKQTQLMFANRSDYLKLRKYLTGTIQMDRLKELGPNHLSTDEVSSDLKKSFSTFILDSFNGKKRNEISDFEYFSLAYTSLDFLGISPEKMKGNNQLTNLFTDGLHAFYAAHTDLLITNDLGLTKKSKILYSLLNINTKVLSLEEFRNFIKSPLYLNEITLNNFLENIIFDIEKGMRVDVFESKLHPRNTEVIKTTSEYFHYFNEMQIIHENGESDVVLTRNATNYRDFVIWKELETIIDSLISMIGIDNYGQSSLKQKDKDEIKSNNWAGRIWNLPNHKVILEINSGTKKLCLWLMKK